MSAQEVVPQNKTNVKINKETRISENVESQIVNNSDDKKQEISNDDLLKINKK